MAGKGSKRRKEDFKAVQANWSGICWKKPAKGIQRNFEAVKNAPLGHSQGV